MEIRGERECRDCGTAWSYFETGSVACPACGSITSVGRGEPAAHTADGSALDLTAARTAVEDGEPLDRVAALSADAGSDYRRAAGFVDAGELQPLDDTYLVAAELETVGHRLARTMRVGDGEESYLLTLLRAPLEDERPQPDDVPSSLAGARGLAVCRAVDEYVSDLKLRYDDPERPLARALSTLRGRRKRVEALDGDVDPREAERIVGATRDLYAHLARDDEAGLARVHDRLR
jgi:uncharacterized Zn finger protein (UPF0148 family)